MGSCIICGTDVPGRICETHQEDVVFEFEGRRPQQLTPGRFYAGTVDGFAEFGVFVDIGPAVTGLLHRSELDRRLESLDWDSGETVYVQVKGIRDNGNVDLAWSIRQSEAEFRGKLIDDPTGDAPERDPDPTAEASETDAGDAEEASAQGNEHAPVSTPGAGAAQAEGGSVASQSAGSETTTESPAEASSESSSESSGGSSSRQSTETRTETGTESEGAVRAEATTATPASAAEPDWADLERAPVETLAERVDDPVALEARVADVHQTGGPTIFTLRDETGTVEAAAFLAAGERAYPELGTGDDVRVGGVVERRRGELQLEVEEMAPLEPTAADALEARLTEALEAEAEPPAVEFVGEHPALTAAEDDVHAAATAIRRAIIEARPIVVRHPATADGYTAAAAIERAALEQIDAAHADADAGCHLFDRRPIDGAVYEPGDATKDVTDMLDKRERHGEALPLVVCVGVGATADDVEALELLGIYGVERLVVDPTPADPAVGDAVETLVAPESTPELPLTATALAATVAATVEPTVRDDLVHLPATSYRAVAPESFVEIAEEAGFPPDRRDALREAVELWAYYQTYEDKRELIADLLFDGREDLAEHVAGQYREKLGTALETAAAHVDAYDVDGVTVNVLDVAAFGHRFDFPSTPLLVDELHRRQRGGEDDRTGDAEPVATIGIDEDVAHLRASGPVDATAVAAAVAEAVPEGSVHAVGGTDGYVRFLKGEREAVADALVAAVADQLG